MCMVQLEGIEENDLSTREKQNSDSRAKEVIMLMELDISNETHWQIMEETNGGILPAVPVIAPAVAWAAVTAVAIVTAGAIAITAMVTNALTKGVTINNNNNSCTPKK
jgi:hypothetical protein